MKKRQLALVFLLLFSASAMAQTDAIIPFHCTGQEIYQLESLMAQRDGSVVSHVTLAAENGNQPPSSLGTVFYKASPSGPYIVDTLFVVDTIWPPFYMLAPNPQGDGNLRMSIRYEEDDDTSYLHIAHFLNDDLQVVSSEEVVVPICEGKAYDFLGNYTLDSQNDLIMTYYKLTPEGNAEGYIARYGLDGTLKHSAQLPPQLASVPFIAEYSSSPLRYFLWKMNSAQNITVYFLDENFQLGNSYIIERDFNPHVEHFTFGQSLTDDFFVPIGDDEIVVATTYERDSLIPLYDSLGNIWNYAINDPSLVEEGAAVAWFEMRTGQMKRLQRFNEMHGPTTDVCHMGFRRTSDGGFFYVFNESGIIVAVRLDPELNVLWKRYCNPPGMNQAKRYWGCQSATFEEDGAKGMAIAGHCQRKKDNIGGLFWLFIYDDGTVGTNESGMEVRPYSLYPNPTQGELRMQYSPDAEPSQIELHDLQGRLVHSQRGSLQSLNISQLPAGVYTMRVTMKDGNTFVDKVVKE